MIERALSADFSGGARLEFAPEGLFCRIESSLCEAAPRGRTLAARHPGALVEDEPIIAMTARICSAIGCEVVARRGDAEELWPRASAAASTSPCSINLNGVASLPVADALKIAGTPFISPPATARACAAATSNAPFAKPYRVVDLQRDCPRDGLS